MTDFNGNFYLLQTWKIINSSYFNSSSVYLKPIRSYFGLLFPKLPLIMLFIFLKTFSNCWPSSFFRYSVQSWYSIYFAVIFVYVYISWIFVSSQQHDIANAANDHNHYLIFYYKDPSNISVITTLRVTQFYTLLEVSSKICFCKFHILQHVWETLSKS